MHKEVFIEPVEPERVYLDDDELNFFLEHAAELNYHLITCFKAENPAEKGGTTADLASYAFRMGREFERNLG